MITPEEIEEIIQEALERILRALPETIGNLMKAQSMYQQLTKTFYDENPDLKGHSDIVREVVAKVEGDNLTMGYGDILKLALPAIKDQLKIKADLSMKVPSKSPDNGAL